MNNYSEGGTSSDNGWESILNAFVNNNDSTTTNNNSNNNNRGGGSLTPTTAVPTNTNNNNNINDGYAAYLQATYQLNNTNNQQQQDSVAGITDIGGSNYSPLNYNTNPTTQGYSLNMPSTQYNNSQYNNSNTQHQSNNNSSLSPAPINNGYGTSNNSGSSGNRGNRERSNSNNSLQLLDPYSTLIDYQPTPINQMQQQPVNGIGAGNNMGSQGGGAGNGLDYCDALLQGMDDSSFNWLAGAFGATAPNNNNSEFTIMCCVCFVYVLGRGSCRCVLLFVGI